MKNITITQQYIGHNIKTYRSNRNYLLAAICERKSARLWIVGPVNFKWKRIDWILSVGARCSRAGLCHAGNVTDCIFTNESRTQTPHAWLTSVAEMDSVRSAQYSGVASLRLATSTMTTAVSVRSNRRLALAAY